MVIRGLRPEYNSITIDGVQIPSNDAGTISASGDYSTPRNSPGGRAVDLSMISSNSLESIEVFKTVSPDRDAAVLGGTVNFGLREAKASSSGKPLFSLLTQGAYNDLVSTYNDYKFAASAEGRFFKDKLGVFAQGIAQKQDLTSNQLGGSYYIFNKQFPDILDLSSMNLSFIPTEQKRFDVDLSLDYRLPDGKIVLVNLFSHGNTRREYHSETYNLEGNSIQFGTQLTTNQRFHKKTGLWE